VNFQNNNIFLDFSKKLLPTTINASVVVNAAVEGLAPDVAVAHRVS
jgi:hypothetical protein